MTNRMTTGIAAGMGALAVALGALGAHAMKPLLIRNGAAEIWETAVFYHFIHVILLVMLAFRQPFLRGPWLCFLIGIMVFSGSLYVLACSNARWLGAVTPFGGLILIVGWCWLGISARRAV